MRRVPRERSVTSSGTASGAGGIRTGSATYARPTAEVRWSGPSPRRCTSTSARSAMRSGSLITARVGRPALCRGRHARSPSRSCDRSRARRRSGTDTTLSEATRRRRATVASPRQPERCTNGSASSGPRRDRSAVIRAGPQIASLRRWWWVLEPLTGPGRPASRPTPARRTRTRRRRRRTRGTGRTSARTSGRA